MEGGASDIYIHVYSDMMYSESIHTHFIHTLRDSIAVTYVALE